MFREYYEGKLGKLSDLFLDNTEDNVVIGGVTDEDLFNKESFYLLDSSGHELIEEMSAMLRGNFEKMTQLMPTNRLEVGYETLRLSKEIMRLNVGGVLFHRSTSTVRENLTQNGKAQNMLKKDVSIYSQSCRIHRFSEVSIGYDFNGEVVINPIKKAESKTYFFNKFDLYEANLKFGTKKPSIYPANIKSFSNYLLGTHLEIRNHDLMIATLDVLNKVAKEANYNLLGDLLKDYKKSLNKGVEIPKSFMFDLKFKEVVEIKNKSDLIDKKFFGRRLNFLKKYSVSQILMLRKFYYKNKGFLFPESYIKNIVKSFDEALENSIYKNDDRLWVIKDYVAKYSIEKSINNDKVSLRMVSDYFRMCSVLGMKPEFYFKGVKAYQNEHERISRLYTELNTGEINVPKNDIFKDNLFEMAGIDGYELIDSKKRIVEEAEVQKHCVASYVGHINRGVSSIYTVFDANQRYTLELRKKDSKNVTLAQLRGLRNNSANKAFENKVRSDIRKINLELNGGII